MGHEMFTPVLFKVLHVWLKFKEDNIFANVGLKFMGKFVTSFSEDVDEETDEDENDETHPILVSCFDFLLKTISPKAIIRFRMCQSVNSILDSLGPEAVLDDAICDQILSYMSDRIKDKVALVRVQAVYALHRLQVPNDPDDPVVGLYKFHLANDPSAKVRQAIISLIGRCRRTIPDIIERLWDVEESVRRHCILQMSSYPIKSYKIEQRVIFLEQGLNDRSDSVKKVRFQNILI